MNPDTEMLQEVVVEAFGAKTRKISATGAVTSVDVASLQLPATSLANALGGRVAGIISRNQVENRERTYPNSGCVVLVHSDIVPGHWF